MAIKIIDLKKFESLNLSESNIIRGASRYISIPSPSLVQPIPRIKPTPFPSPPQPVLPTPVFSPREPY